MTDALQVSMGENVENLFNCYKDECQVVNQDVCVFVLLLLLAAGSDMAIFCLLCGKRFQTQPALQQHMEVHAGVRSYICSECNRTFPSHTALKRHLRSHTGKLQPRCAGVDFVLTINL